MMRLVIFVISVVISVSMVSSCGEVGDAVKEALSEAESCIEDDPRHSLEILKQIDTSSLSSRKIRAKYSLLYSMALDKNYIDVTTDSIISPAAKFYKHHGTPQERMLTNYYLGRIRMNASNYEEALLYLTSAERYVKRVDNDIAIARLYKAQSKIFQYIYDSEMMVATAKKAASHFLSANDTTRYINTLNDIISGYLQCRDTLDVLLYLDEIKNHWEVLTPRQMSNYYSSKLFLNEYYAESNVNEILLNYFEDVTDFGMIRWLSVANAYYYIGNVAGANDALEKFRIYENSSSPLYFLLSGQVNSSLGLYREATEAFERYVDITGEKNGFIFGTDAKFIKEREISRQKEVIQKFEIITLALSGILLLILLIYFVLRSRWSRKEKILSEEKHMVELQLLEEKQKEYQHMYDEAIDEVEYLKGLLDFNKEPSVRHHLLDRLNLLNTFIVEYLVSGSSSTSSEVLKKFIQDKQHFMDSTRQSFIVAHPELIEYLEQRDLTHNEICCCCLYMIGLRGKDIANYLEMNSGSYYKFSSNLRKKLGMSPNDTNIDKYLQRLLNS